MSSLIWPLGTDREIIEFAEHFLRGRASGFKKDIDICLTANADGKHAYFPGLITCIAFIDLLSGLYAGQFDGHGREEFLNFCRKFIARHRYDELGFTILYEGFRHKIAHHGHPYPVFDTGTKPRIFQSDRRLVTWKIYASRRKCPVELITYPKRQQWTKRIVPWPMFYDHRIVISIRSLEQVARNTLRGPNGYIDNLRADKALRDKFVKCMKEFFPT